MQTPPYQRTWAEISLDAIAHNVAAARARLRPGTKLMCVVKANGYGHGACAIAKFLHEQCDFFAVAILEEGLALRAAGIAKPILVLGHVSARQYEAALAAGLALTIYSAEDARALSRAAVALGKTATVHLKIDTGMNRIGFADTEKSAREIMEIMRLQCLAIKGIYTHFARAEEVDKAALNEQYSRFQAFLERGGLEGESRRFLRHCCNSAAFLADTPQFDMVRLGILLYGLYPSEQVKKSNISLLPAMAWKTHVVHLKTVPPGAGVSYGHIFVASRQTRVATLPIGYADGYPRALSNQGHVLLHGQFAPIIGCICMDQCMIDVTEIPNVAMEDEVILLGEADGKKITMEEIGRMSASFNYETACRVGSRVPRVYIHHGEPVNLA
jgi:alanine racemase